jgi:uncharacterized protein (TIGR02246 family)
MTKSSDHERAYDPEDLSGLFLERANAGDVDGVVALYEVEAVLVGAAGQQMTGIMAIRRYYQQLFAGGPTLNGETQPALRSGDLALTSTRFTITAIGIDGQPTMIRTATVEVARHQPDGTWLWVIDHPNILA